jgi:hypothetical protein
MSGRDLLHKPQVPQVLPDDASGEKKVDKTGTKAPRARDLGGVPGDEPAMPAPRADRVGPPTRTPAHRAAYFNRDTSGVHEVNQRASNMAALRGGQGATDLKKIVLPPAIGVDHPEPEVLRGAGDLIGLDGSLDLSLESFLGRQGQWVRQKGVTVEMLEARMAQLEEMVAARKAALLRMINAPSRELPSSVTVAQAVSAHGEALEESEDLAAEGRELIGRVAEQAEGMHRRLAKMLGIKR